MRLSSVKVGLERVSDDFLHDFVRAAVDSMHAAVRPHAGHGIIRYVPVAAVQLNALVEDSPFAIGQPVLRHGGGRRVQSESMQTVLSGIEANECLHRSSVSKTLTAASFTMNDRRSSG